MESEYLSVAWRPRNLKLADAALYFSVLNCWHILNSAAPVPTYDLKYKIIDIVNNQLYIE